MPPPKGTIHRSSEGNSQFAVTTGEDVRYQPFSKFRLMKYCSKNELTLWPRSMNSSNPLTKRCGNRFGFTSLSFASRKGPDVVRQCADCPPPGLYKSHK